MKLGALFQDIPIRQKFNWNPNKTIRKITSDSRAIESGDVFVACPGSRMDGHDFLGQAILDKAAAIVFENAPEWPIPHPIVGIQVKNSQECFSLLLAECFSHPDRKMRLVGVTGTNGKTTISYLLHQLIREKEPAAYLGTLWYDFLGEKRAAINTTPGADVLFSFLADMVREKINTCIMEVSSHALEQKRVFGLEFELAIFTQLTQDHLDYHKNMDGYFRAKRLLFESQPPPRQMLINRDCPYGRKLLGVFPQARSYSLEDQADYQAVDVALSFQGSQFNLRYPGGEIPIQTRFPMRHNVANMVAILSAMDMLGFDLRQIRTALPDLSGVPGRMESVVGSGPFRVFVDYAHTPDAIINVLAAAQSLKPKRILTLIGCGGDRDRSKRPLMAQAACDYSDLVIFTSDNPRSEDPESIIQDMKKGIQGRSLKSEVQTILDRRDAIEKLISLASAGDAVFILGKGHENYQILGECKIPFDDRVVASECLRKSRVFLS